MRDDQFERLYEEHAHGLYGFLAYRTGDKGLAEDLLADTFEKALRSRARFDPRRGSQRTWLYAIALNLLRDHARRRAAEDRATERMRTDAATGEHGAIADVFQRDDVLRALSVLADEEREALALKYGADLTAPEIAKMTGEKLTTIEGRIYRGLRKARQVLEGDDDR